jgi:hypothetical protein
MVGRRIDRGRQPDRDHPCMRDEVEDKQGGRPMGVDTKADLYVPIVIGICTLLVLIRLCIEYW